MEQQGTSRRGLLRLTWGLRDGAPVSVREVESGLACGCLCPACGERLVAKKGARMLHHFSHHRGGDCAYGYETSLHLMAKELLRRAGRLVIPAVRVEFNTRKDAETVAEAREIAVDQVELECHLEGVVPDVVVTSGGKRLFVEIFVTHRVDGEKLARLREMGVSTLEIDLSRLDHSLTEEELARLLLTDHALKSWRYNAVAERVYRLFCEAADRREIVRRGLASHVDYCPLRKRLWRGKPYANVLDDCADCPYEIAALDGAILCSGRRRVAHLSDLLSPAPPAPAAVTEEEAMRAVAAGRCPSCGAALIERHETAGRLGASWTCSRAPHCAFFASLDSLSGVLRLGTDGG